MQFLSRMQSCCDPAGYSLATIGSLYAILVKKLLLYTDAVTDKVFQKKWHKVYGNIILQLYVTVNQSCTFQQNVQKEIVHTTKTFLNTKIRHSLFRSRQMNFLKKMYKKQVEVL